MNLKIKITTLLLLLLSFVGAAPAAAQSVKVNNLSRVEMRNFNEIVVVGNIENGTPNDISVSETKVTLYLHGSNFAKVTQIATATAPANTTADVELILRIDSIDPMHAMTLMSMLSQKKFDGITLDAEGLARIGDMEQRIIQRNINLTNIMTIFAPN